MTPAELSDFLPDDARLWVVRGPGGAALVLGTSDVPDGLPDDLGDDFFREEVGLPEYDDCGYIASDFHWREASEIDAAAYGTPWGLRTPHNDDALRVFEAIEILKDKHRHHQQRTDRETANAQRQALLFATPPTPTTEHTP